MEITSISKSSKIIKTKMPLIIGSFDVIHKGHMTLFNEVEPNNFCVLLIDHIPHKPHTFNSLEDRILNIQKFRPTQIFVYDVKKHNVTAIDFVNKILTKLGPSCIIVGTDFNSGSDYKGGPKLLSSYFMVKPIKYDNQYQTSIIKENYKKGKIEIGREMLCFPILIKGNVVSGKQLGRQIGFPTLNFFIDSTKKFIYKPGVYAAYAYIHDKEYKAAVYVAKSTKTKQLFEVHILDDFQYVDEKENINQEIKIDLLKYINGLKKVNSINELKKCISLNIRKIKLFFNSKNKSQI